MLPKAQELEKDELEYRAKLAATYISASQAPDGTFAYEYDFWRARYLDGDSIVRQAGAGFALAEYLNKTGDPDIRKACELAIVGMAGRSVAFQDGVVVSADRTLEKAATGATALALLTELNWFERTRSRVFEQQRLKWLNGLASSQLSTGAFAKRPGSESDSPYYNGEVWLALATFQRIFPDDASIRDVLAKAEKNFMPRYLEDPDVGFLHWGLMAANERHRATREGRFLDFLATLATQAVLDVRPTFSRNSNAAYLVEGLASAAAALLRAGREQDALLRILLDRIEKELRKSCEFQILPGQSQISPREGCYLIDPKIGEMAGACLNGRYRPKSRIDFTQHFLSAVMKYQLLQSNESASVTKEFDVDVLQVAAFKQSVHSA